MPIYQIVKRKATISLDTNNPRTKTEKVILDMSKKYLPAWLDCSLLRCNLIIFVLYIYSNSNVFQRSDCCPHPAIALSVARPDGLAKKSARTPPVKAKNKNAKKFKGATGGLNKNCVLLSDCAIKKHNS